MNKKEIYFDASLKDGLVGIGVISTDKEFNDKFQFVTDSSYLGETMGLICAITLLRGKRKNLNDYIVYTDCQGLYENVKNIELGVEVRWISRDFNIAHELSNEARTSGAKMTKVKKQAFKKLLEAIELTKINRAFKLANEKKLKKMKAKSSLIEKELVELISKSTAYQSALQTLNAVELEELMARITRKLLK